MISAELTQKQIDHNNKNTVKKYDIRDHENWCHEDIDEGGDVNCDSNEHKQTL